MVEKETHNRSSRRAKEEDETVDGVTNHHCEDTMVEEELEDVIETIIKEFGYVEGVLVEHPMVAGSTNHLIIWVYTDEVNEIATHVDLYGPEHRIVIETDDDSPTYDFEVRASSGSPIGMDSHNRTTIYLNENVVGGGSLNLDTALDLLRDKLVNPDDWEPKRTDLPLIQIPRHTE